MKNLRLLGVVCACLFTLIFSHTGHAASVLYDYIGNDFTSNNTTKPLCTTPGQTGCLSYITASIELSTALGINEMLMPITPDAWSISDGLTTITNLTADFSLSFLQAGTDATGNIDKWDFVVVRNVPTLIGELSYIQTQNASSPGEQDVTAYFSGATDLASVSKNSGSWTMSTVPLPGAIWLFGSGLLGLFGLSRRSYGS